MSQCGRMWKNPIYKFKMVKFIFKILTDLKNVRWIENQIFFITNSMCKTYSVCVGSSAYWIFNYLIFNFKFFTGDPNHRGYDLENFNYSKN